MKWTYCYHPKDGREIGVRGTKIVGLVCYGRVLSRYIQYIGCTMAMPCPLQSVGSKIEIEPWDILCHFSLSHQSIIKERGLLLGNMPA